MNLKSDLKYFFFIFLKEFTEIVYGDEFKFIPITVGQNKVKVRIWFIVKSVVIIFWIKDKSLISNLTL